MYRTICIWPCGTWCDKDDIEEYTYMSDDYRLVTVGIHTPDEIVDNIVQYLV